MREEDNDGMNGRCRMRREWKMREAFEERRGEVVMEREEGKLKGRKEKERNGME